MLKPIHPVTTKNYELETPTASTSAARHDLLDYEHEDPSSEDEMANEVTETFSRSESAAQGSSDDEQQETATSSERKAEYEREFQIFWRDRKAYIERLVRNYEAKLE